MEPRPFTEFTQGNEGFGVTATAVVIVQQPRSDAMLSSLEIKSFKGIKEGTISNLAQVNVLVGRNNSGKSTVLDALLLMRCAFAVIGHTGNNGLEQIVKRKINREGSLNLRELHYMLDTNQRASLVAGFPDGTTVSEDWNTYLQQLELDIEVDGRSQKWKHNISVGPGLILENSLTRDHGLFMAEKIGSEKAKLIANGYQIEPNSIRFPFLETIWEKIIIDRRDRKLREIANEIYQIEIEGFDQSQFGGYNRLVAKLPDRSVAIDWMGDGLRYALNILAPGMLLEGTILMVEEPETHQHPESLKKLTQTLFELAKRQNLQLFLTTHSWELMTYALEAAEQKEVGLTMHHVRLNDKGEFDSRAIPSPDAKLLMDIGHDIRLHDKYLKAR